MPLTFLQSKPGLYEINGELTFSNIDRNTLQSIQMGDDASEIIIDLSQVTKIDSAALAVLVELMSIAKQQNKQFSIQNTPDQLTALAKLTGLDDVIPLTNTQGR